MKKTKKESKTKQIGGRTIDRVIAIFLNRKEPSLSPKDVFRIIKLSTIKKDRDHEYHGVYSAIRQLLKEGIISKSARRGRFTLKDRDKALHRLSQGKKDFVFLDPLSTPPNLELRDYFLRFMDMERAILERVRIEIRVDGYTCKAVRDFLMMQGIQYKKGDRRKSLSWSDGDISFVVSKTGWMQFWLKGQMWHTQLLRVLQQTGMKEASVVDVFRAISYKLPQSDMSVEVPLKVLRSDLPKEWTAETKVGDKTIVSRISSSHFPAELEMQGFAPVVMSFLNSLAAVQHFSPLDILQFEYTQSMLGYIRSIQGLLADESLRRGLSDLGADINKISKAFSDLSSGFAPAQPVQEPDPEEERENGYKDVV